jgi:hypothetical protein
MVDIAKFGQRSSEPHRPPGKLDKSILPPVIVKHRPVRLVPPEALGAVDQVAARQRTMSAFIGGMAAVVLHLVLIGIFTMIALGVLPRELPPKVIVIDGYEPLDENDKRAVNKRVAQRPAPASMHAMNTIAASAVVATISTPVVEKPVDDPIEFSSAAGLSDGIGFASVGIGLGSKNFMGLQAGGKNIILVIDTSSSMPRNCGENGIAAIRREIIRTINGFSRGTRFNIICYANDADAFRPTSVPATSQNKAAAIRFMRIYFDEEKLDLTRTQTFGGEAKGAEDPSGIGYMPIYADGVKGLEGTSGGSRIELGLVAAMQSQPSTIFVLSDGEPITTRGNTILSHSELITIIRDNYNRIYQGKKLVVNTLSIHNLGEKFLREVSFTLNGKHRKIDPEKL